MTLGGNSGAEVFVGDVVDEVGVHNVLIRLTRTRVDSFLTANESVRRMRSRICSSPVVSPSNGLNNLSALTTKEGNRDQRLP